MENISLHLQLERKTFMNMYIKEGVKTNAMWHYKRYFGLFPKVPRSQDMTKTYRDDCEQFLWSFWHRLADENMPRAIIWGPHATFRNITSNNILDKSAYDGCWVLKWQWKHDYKLQQHNKQNRRMRIYREKLFKMLEQKCTGYIESQNTQQIWKQDTHIHQHKFKC